MSALDHIQTLVSFASNAAMPGPRGDPTVVDPTERAKIESYVGLSLQTVEPEAIKFVVDRSKQAGNTAFKEKRYQGAGCCSPSAQ